MSKEHLWPDWLRNYILTNHDDRNISELHVGEGKSPRRLQNRTERQGNVITKKIRVVCQTCNNGWMSCLEEAVKPILVGLIREDRTPLHKEQINALSLWTAVKTIVGEHAQSNVALTPTTDRHQVYCDGVVPHYFRIYAGLHSSETKAAYVRHSTTVSRSWKGPNPPLPPEINRNIQSVSFLVGPLLLHVIAARVADFSIDETFSFKGLAKLWPSTLEQLDLFSLRRLDNNDLATIANQLNDLVRSPMVGYWHPSHVKTRSLKH